MYVNGLVNLVICEEEEKKKSNDDGYGKMLEKRDLW